MGGKITLESLGLNQGTTVIIQLPLTDLALLPNAEKKDIISNGVRS
jgi:hypothetical protein